jgi:hypothetical protein
MNTGVVQKQLRSVPIRLIVAPAQVLVMAHLIPVFAVKKEVK